MINWIVKAGIVLIPFAIFPGMNSREPKEIVAFGLALSLILTAFYQGGFRPFHNIWLLVFIGFSFISICLAPQFNDFIFTFVKGDPVKHIITSMEMMPARRISGLWMYKSFLFILVYSLMLIIAASRPLGKKDIEGMLKAMMYSGLLMALYLFVQKAGLDQFFWRIPPEVDQSVNFLKEPALGGFLGQSTVVSPYIAMLVPLALYFRKYFVAGVMAAAVMLTLSKMAVGAMAAGLFVYFMFSVRRYHRMAGIVLISAMILFISFWSLKNPGIFQPSSWISVSSHGRTGAWKTMWEDFRTPVDDVKHTITGFGPGTFTWSHSIRHNNQWWQAHNDPFEALYNFGIAGVCLLFLAVRRMLKNINFKDDLTWAMLMMLLVVFLCSLGTFPFQIAPIYFYVVIILGFLHNPILTEVKNGQSS